MVLAAGGMHLLDLHFNFLQKENIKIYNMQKASNLKLGRPFTCTNLDLM